MDIPSPPFFTLEPAETCTRTLQAGQLTKAYSAGTACFSSSTFSATRIAASASKDKGRSMLSIVLHAGSAMIASKAPPLGSKRAPAISMIGTRPAVIDTTAAEELDVVIVGAGAAGVGCALMLTKTFGLDASRVVVVERGDEVGATFRRWPAEMRFISPSFNMQGWTRSFDLNSVAFGTSPAFSLHEQHPSGDQYADYLNALAESSQLRVRTRTEVTSVRPVGAKGDPQFSVGVRSRPGGARRLDGLRVRRNPAAPRWPARRRP